MRLTFKDTDSTTGDYSEICSKKVIQSSWFDIIGEYWIFLFTNLTKHLHTSFKILPPTIKQLFFYQKKTPLQIFASIMISEMSLMSTLLCSNYFMVFYTIVKSALLVGDSKNEKIQNFFISSKISKSLWYDKTPIICYKFIHRKVLHLWDYKECLKTTHFNCCLFADMIYSLELRLRQMMDYIESIIFPDTGWLYLIFENTMKSWFMNCADCLSSNGNWLLNILINWWMANI